LAEGSLLHHVFEGEWQDAGTIESLLQASNFVAPFASKVPIDTAHQVSEVEAEPVQAARAAE
jgi:NDP-sugar pyrophosphorylase family protein